MAQQKDKPTPEQLWDAYPLEPGSEKADPADPAPTPTPTLSLPPEPSRPAVVVEQKSDGGGHSTLLFIAGGILLFGVGIGAGSLLRRRLRDRAAASARSTPQRTAARPKPRRTPAQAKRARAKPPARPAPPKPTAQAVQPKPRREPTAKAVQLKPRPEQVVETTPAPPPPTFAPPVVQELELPAAERFARRRPWPRGVADLWTCEIEWKPGYRKSRFRAMAARPGESQRQPVGESAPVMWTLMSEPDPPTPEKVAVLRHLLEALQEQGWERIEPAGPWYAQRLVWRRDGQPRPMTPLTGKAADA